MVAPERGPVPPRPPAALLVHLPEVVGLVGPPGLPVGVREVVAGSFLVVEPVLVERVLERVVARRAGVGPFVGRTLGPKGATPGTGGAGRPAHRLARRSAGGAAGHG